ncbi:hypothetical protein A7U60_g2548 [Sanghuangporus baumii]|uniref:Uncharacterized protein n=1 Tax=Sanghuangporus baumii TaxID=108892 RepID=A0A9Q5NAK0_SANBA|nr:hypothetical protein A7U60_g2548 [Sanghuangporus baumii]
MVVTRRMARENASRNNDSNSDASDRVAANHLGTAAVYRDTARDNISNRASSRRRDANGNDEALQPYTPTENNSTKARLTTAVCRSRAAPRRRGRKTASSSKPHLAKQATTKAGGLNMPNEVNSNEDESQPSPVKRGEKRRREGGAEESNKENSATGDCETVPKSVRRIRRRAAKAPNDESETTPTNKASLLAAEGSLIWDSPQCISTCNDHSETDAIAAYALVELSSGRLIQEDEIKDAIYRPASGGKLKAVHPAPTVIA